MFRHKISIKIILICLIFINGCCFNPVAFELDADNKGQYGGKIWQHGGEVSLVNRYIDVGAAGYRTWLSLEKSLVNHGTIAYSFYNKQCGFRELKIINDTLFLYKEEEGIACGWYVNGIPDDSLTIKELSYPVEGLYKLESNTLKMVDENSENFFKLSDGNGAYLLSPKRSKDFFSLKDLSEKMFKIKSWEDAPDEL